MTKQSTWKQAHDDMLVEKSEHNELILARKRIELYTSLCTPTTTKIPDYKSNQGEAIAVIQASDWHVEERVDTKTIAGCNNCYTPEIARKRSEQFFQRSLILVNAQRTLTNIKTLCLHIGGDIITGYIHEELKQTNWLSPTKAVLLGHELLSNGIRYLLDKGEFENIIIVCNFGNHGRTTDKKQISNAADNSFEWLMYTYLAKEWHHEKRVKFHIAEGYHIYIRLGNTLCRFHHGDNVDYGGGVGGISIPLNKAVNEWNKIQHADLDFICHFHQCRDFGNIICNGSLIGYNAFALSIKAPYEPPRQSFTLIDAKRGKSLFAHIWTDYLNKEVA